MREATTPLSRSAAGRRAGALPNIPAADGDVKERFASIVVEVYVPHDALAGSQGATLTLTHGSERIDVPISLRIWNFTLPDHLSFIPQMNCYSLPGPPDELHYTAWPTSIAPASTACLTTGAENRARAGHRWLCARAKR